MNRHRYININRLLGTRGFFDKKRTLFKSASYVSEENILAYFLMMFYTDEIDGCMGRTGLEAQPKKESLYLADCLPNLNLIFLRWDKNNIKRASEGIFLKILKKAAGIFKNRFMNFIAGKKEKICFVYLNNFAIIKKIIHIIKSRLVESNVINDYLKLLVLLDHKSRRCFYSLSSSFHFYFSKYFKSIKESYCQMTRLTSGLKGVIWGMALAAVLVLPSGAFAENVKYASSLVWRADGAGDYNMPGISPNSQYISLPVVISKSLIKAITITWESRGEVTMEASADGGVHFKPVVNGVPLIKDFTQGTSLRWRATVGPDGSLSEVRVSYIDASGLAGSFGEPQLSGFKYRKQFYVKGAGTVSLFNYQVNIRVGESEDSPDIDLSCGGRAADGFEDVRFTLADGETLIPYFLEKISGEEGKRTAKFVVKIPQIPASGIPVFIYYGNPQALSLSDGKSVFDFYDDFKAEALDKGAWSEALSAGGSVSLSENGLVLDAGCVLSKDFQFKGGFIEFSAMLQTGNETRLIIRQGNSQLGTDKSQVAYSSSYSGAEHCIAAGDIVKVNDPNAVTQGETYDYRVKAKEDEIIFERYSQGFGEKQAFVTYIDTDGLRAGPLGLKTSGTARAGNASVFHWVRVRKYAEPEPAIDVEQTGDEEMANIAYFDGVALSTKGNLILKEGFKEGVYITPVERAQFDARIISSGWEGEGVRVDITADGGESACLNCGNFSYYYAPEGDFGRGSDLKARVILKNKSAVLKELSLQYAAGSITVLSPNGGEIWNVGSRKPITWTAWDYDKTYPLKIELSVDNGKTFSLITERAENRGLFEWVIPVDTDLLTTKAKIRISDSNDQDISDMSDVIFSIAPAGLDMAGSSRAAGEESGEDTPVARQDIEQAQGSDERVIEKKQDEEEDAIDLDVSLMDPGRRKVNLYDVVIKLNDNTLSDDFIKDSRGSFKAGDVIMIVPAGHTWTETEKNSFLIVQMFLTKEETVKLTMPSTSGDAKKRFFVKRKYKFDLEKLEPEKKGRRKNIEKIESSLQGKTWGEVVVEKR